MLSQHPAHRLQRPSPAIVSQDAVWRLPRWVLWLLCVVYSVVGFGLRQPWRGDDLLSLGWAQAIAEGRSGWLMPQLDGFLAPAWTWLPYWLGAISIRLCPSWIPLDVAMRLPFIALLLLSFVAIWYATYALARMPEAQPLPFALGGEAQPKDYGRTVADGAVLAWMATLGLAQIGHEAGPSLMRVAFVALWLYAISVQLYAVQRSRIWGGIAAFGLAFSGAPILLFFLGLLHLALPSLLRPESQRSPASETRERGLPLVLMAVAFSLLSLLLGLLQLGFAGTQEAAAAVFGHKPTGSLLRLLLWFFWPTGLLALLALWAWRAWWRSPHILLPAAVVAVIVPTWFWSRAAEESLLLASPAVAILAAMFLPTMQRTVSAWIDWFTLVFFSICSVTIGVVWLSLATGWPAKPAQNALRLLPGFEFQFSAWALLLAVLVTVLWLALIVWRVGRDRSAIWKSLAMPAGGVLFCWVLLLTLWGPLLDYGRSYEAWAAPIAQSVQRDALALVPATGKAEAGSVLEPVQQAETSCLYVQGLQLEQLAALHYYKPLPIYAMAQKSIVECDWLLLPMSQAHQLPGLVGEELWALQSQWQRLANRGTSDQAVLLYKRERAL